jgi:hypothetical protein
VLIFWQRTQKLFENFVVEKQLSTATFYCQQQKHWALPKLFQ